MNRVAIALVAVLMGAAAPARAWCEASCLAKSAHAESAKPHCPAHESPSDGARISAIDTNDCPTIDTARPVPATLAVSLPMVSAIAPEVPAPRASRHIGTQAPPHLLSVPLRI